MKKRVWYVIYTFYVIFLMVAATEDFENTTTIDDFENTTAIDDVPAISFPTTATVQLTCSELLKAFQKHIKSATGETVKDSISCSMSRIKTISKTIQSLDENILNSPSEDGTIVVTLDSNSMSDVLVLSVLGLMIGTRHGDKVPTLSYVYNEESHSLQPEFELCKFEKILYVTLLCTTIIILIALLTLQMDHANEAPPIKKEDASDAPYPPSGKKYILTPTQAMASFGNQLKYRV